VVAGFKDPKLQELIRIALKQNDDIGWRRNAPTRRARSLRFRALVCFPNYPASKTHPDTYSTGCFPL